MARDFRELRVWEAAMDLTEQVYRMVADFPADERYGLSAQLKRAAVSVPSCIAEGNARSATLDYLRFLSMAAGSLAEINTQILLAARLGLGSKEKRDRCLQNHASVTKLLMALQTSLRASHTKAVAKRSSPFPVPRSRP